MLNWDEVHSYLSCALVFEQLTFDTHFFFNVEIDFLTPKLRFMMEIYENLTDLLETEFDTVD